MKPLAAALRDRNTIRAIIRGTGSNQDGRTPGITLPSGIAQEALIREVYARAGLDPSETEVVEAHGTGTQAGDPVETGAIARVFGNGRSPTQPLRIGSIKTNVGHLEGASGVAGVIKAVLMLENRMILPSRNFEKVNSRIPLQEWNLKVCFSLTIQYRLRSLSQTLGSIVSRAMGNSCTASRIGQQLRLWWQQRTCHRRRGIQLSE